MMTFSHTSWFTSAIGLPMLACIACLSAYPGWASAQTDPQQFLASYCIDCHTADDPSGDREFSSLDFTDSGIETQLGVQEIIDQLTLEAMPPEDGEQPTEAERLTAIRSLTKILQTMRDKTASTGGKTVLRRLSRREYRNTVGDLLGIDMTMFDPTNEFPGENISEGFDNVGDTLTMSGFLLEKYLDAADACVEKAFATASYPDPKRWTFKDNFQQQAEVDRAHKIAFDRRHLILYDHPLNDKPEGAFGPLNNFKEGVPADGIYEVRVRAEALHRDTPYGSQAVFIDLSEPFRMGIRPGNARVGHLAKTQSVQPKLAEAVIADNDPQWYTFQVPLDRGFSPRFTFENGQHDVRGSYARVFRLHKETFPKRVQGAEGIVDRRIASIQHGFLPQIRIHEVQIYGPLPESPQRTLRDTLLGGAAFDANTVPTLLTQFVAKAYRRTVKTQEISELHALYQARLAMGRNAIDAYKDTLKAILCSPEFLYFDPPHNAQNELLSQHGLAERLSFFLTSSMPDDRLQKLADAGTLNSPSVLREEALRLLASESSDRFVADFLDSWLDLRSLGSMPPDLQAFRQYYTANLEPEMKQETRLFTRDLIDRNASVLEFLQANHSYANRDLAKLYGVEQQIPIAQAGDFHRVVFDDPNRGGLLGQASVLTVTANGIETSPVMRGVWLLEKIMGTPPAPPPDDVPAIDPDVRGATSIRDQLVKHRDSATCNECHHKIDPPGFALEAFDPIGRTRTFYDRKRKNRIDTSGVLPSGKRFENVAELKKRLLEQQAFFVRTVTTRLLTHALGRHVEATDRAAVDQIIVEVQEAGYPTRDLIVAIVTSKLFQQR